MDVVAVDIEYAPTSVQFTNDVRVPHFVNCLLYTSDAADD